MEHDTVDLNDPIAVKLRDSAAVERLVRQAVAEAVEKARKLGFLEEGRDQVKRPNTD